ncbi:DNA damage response protein WSS1 [Pyrus ussuriensis x Pyrus communis]|uniref:DNA damage response protein WSS1 n=1 Tax=Pyrus ussuriensis x Pyrus communis TaxID=2448454 RepID=A0A5N5G671_9ROSA|nr:DNA damage response protein WSS1 [Pyrus ussuriensis x Pyrus communis]
MSFGGSIKMKEPSWRNSGPKRLGGDSNIKAALSPVQAVATSAEWRLHDDSWCGSKSREGDIEVQGNVGTSQRAEPFTFTDGISTQTSIKPKPGQEEIDDQALNCRYMRSSTCVLMCWLLQPLTLSRSACGTLKEDVKFKVWSSKFCTSDNRVKPDRCLSCRQWRYGLYMNSKLTSD